MPSISQKISSYIQGISHQPDDMMTPGQVRDLENGLPDVTTGLIKRNGTTFITSLDFIDEVSSALKHGNQGNWFSYYRDKNEGGYIGVIEDNGQIALWDLQGNRQTVYNFDISGWNTIDGNLLTTRQYLTNDGNSTAEDLKFTTINDYTFVTNPKVTVKVDTGLNLGSNMPWKPTYYWTDTGLWAYGSQHDYVNRRSHPSMPVDPEAYRNITKNEFPNKKFVQIKQLKQGAEYGLRILPTPNDSPNIWGDQKVYYVGRTNTATRVSVEVIDAGNDDGDCPTVGTGIYRFDSIAGSGVPSKEEPIYVRITQTGQSHINPLSTDIDSGADYKCTYNFNHELLYGGRGWNFGEQTHTLFGPASVGSSDQAEFRLKIEETTSDEKHTTDWGGEYDLFVKAPPVSFEASTPVSARAIYQHLKYKLEDRGFSCDLQSNGLVVWTLNEEPFDLTSIDESLMTVSGTNISNITELPREGPSEFPDWFVKVSNASERETDDYYLRWDNTEKPGRWVETLGDDISFRLDPFTMPHVLWRQANGTFVFDQYRGERKGPHKDEYIGSSAVSDLTWSYDYHRGQSGWEHRKVGDNVTNPFPSFVGKKITNTFFHRNRLGFLHDGSVSLSEANTIGNFFNTSALTTTANDPINLDAGSTEPTTFISSIETNTGLVVFGESEQYLLHTDSDSLTNETAKLSNISTYNYSPATEPLPLGTTISFVDSTGTNGRFFEMFDIKREGEPSIIEQSKIVQDLIPSDIDITANSREASTVFLSKAGQQYVWGYRYYNQGQKRIQSSWFKWKMAFNVRYMTVIEGLLYFVSTKGKLYSMNLDTNGYSITGGANNPWGQPGTLNVHLDCSETHDLSGVNYGTDTTTVYPKMHLFSTFGPNTEDVGGEPYAIGADGVIVQGTNNLVTDVSWTFPGILQKPVTTGYAYDLKVKFPKIFLKKQEGEAFVSDVTASLTVQRVKLHFGPIGHTSVDISRQGKPNYTIENNVTFADWIESDGTPVVTERVVETPIYEKNTNFEIELKSTYPGPASLHSMTWEGEYSSKHHKRV
tara:strand:+ start:1306 stop:4437 length:3132 start_codon:yes stop_codon:yes gene_type:complete